MAKNIFDEVGYWSEIKLDIIKKYAYSYSKIILGQRKFKHVYIDAFAGSGKHKSKATQEFIPGSPVNALKVTPPFSEYYFVDINHAKVKELEKIAKERPGQVHVYEGDCNQILSQEIFSKIQWKDFRRGLCLLDPYGLQLDWDVIQAAGKMKSIEIFLNFPVADINRNVLWQHPENVGPEQIARMNRFWGDESWREVAYDTQTDLFGYPEKVANEVVAEAFRQRLKDVAGFGYVSTPLPMKNSKKAIVYYLYFASPKPVALKIVEEIFDKYRRR